MSIAHTSPTFGPPRVDMTGVAGSADANVGSASEQVSSPVPSRSAASMAMAQQLPQTDTHAPTTFSAPNPLKPTLGSFPPTAALETMPVELLQMIVESLDANDLASLRKTNGALYNGLSDPVLLSKKMADAIPTLTHPQALNQLLAEVERLPSSISQKLVPLLGEQIEAVLLNFRNANYAGDRTEMEPVIKQFFEKAYNHAPLDGGELMAKAIPMFNSLPTLTQPKALEQLLTAMERLPSPISQKLSPLLSAQIEKSLVNLRDLERVGDRTKAMAEMKSVIKRFFDQACNHAPLDGGERMAKAIPMFNSLPTLAKPKALNELLTTMETLPSPISQKLLPLLSAQIEKALVNLRDHEKVGDRTKAMAEMESVIKRFFDQACNHAPSDGGAQMANAIAMDDTLRNQRAGKLASLAQLEPLFAKREAMMHSGMTLDAPQWAGLRYILLERVMRFNNPSRSGSTQPAIQRFINE